MAVYLAKLAGADATGRDLHKAQGLGDSRTGSREAAGQKRDHDPGRRPADAEDARLVGLQRQEEAFIDRGSGDWQRCASRTRQPRPG